MYRASEIEIKIHDGGRTDENMKRTNVLAVGIRGCVVDFSSTFLSTTRRASHQEAFLPYEIIHYSYITNSRLEMEAKALNRAQQVHFSSFVLLSFIMIPFLFLALALHFLFRFSLMMYKLSFFNSNLLEFMILKIC